MTSRGCKAWWTRYVVALGLRYLSSCFNSCVMAGAHKADLRHCLFRLFAYWSMFCVYNF